MKKVIDKKLRTLKDFRKDGSSWIIGVSEDDISLDFEKKGFNRREVFPLESLREEAKKWVEEFSGDEYEVMEKYPQIFHNFEPSCEIGVVTNWIKHFFNLEEKG